MVSRRDIAVFLLGFAAGMFFLLTWATRTPMSPMFSGYLMAQVTAAVTLAVGLWLLFKRP